MQLIVAVTLALLVAWAAVHIFGLWALPFLGGFAGTFFYSLWKQHREKAQQRAADTQARIAQLERELGMK
jgi:Zn-dependent protease with chaperone function